MSPASFLPFSAALRDYERAADALLAAATAREDAALWRMKWEHPRFRGCGVTEVRDATLAVEDARAVVAREHGFEEWASLVRFTEQVIDDERVRRFEEAADAVVGGGADELRALLRASSALVHERSARRHRATLLHYVAANGVEQGRQRTPPNALEIATLLLDAGADVDALADVYDARCTTMSMLVSSTPPAEAGLQARLAELLADRGAALEGAGTAWASALLTALQFGYLDTARALARRGAPADTLPRVAGLGLVEEAARLLPLASATERHQAMALAAQLGHAAVVALLLDAGESPDRYNPDGFHSHSTPLHQAVAGGHGEVVRLLVSRGARLDLRDAIYDGTPDDWARHLGREAPG